MAEAAASGEATRLLVSWSNGDEQALAELVPKVYGELYQIAEALGISPVTVARRWRMVKAWLYRHLGEGDRHDS